MSSQLITERMCSKTTTGGVLQSHSMTTPRSPTIPAGSSTAIPWTTNLEESNSSPETHRKTLKAYVAQKALKPGTPGIGGSYQQQWSLLIQKHLNQHYQWYHQ